MFTIKNMRIIEWDMEKKAFENIQDYEILSLDCSLYEELHLSFIFVARRSEGLLPS